MKIHQGKWGHPAVRTGSELTGGERIADRVVQTMGSWGFLIWQTVFVSLWIAVNLLGLALQWDPYPFILLNLAFSTQAAYAAPLILIASNRSDKKASELAQHDFDQNAEALDILRSLRSEN